MGNPFLIKKQRRENTQNPTAALHDTLVNSHTKSELDYIEALKAVGIDKTYQARTERVITADDLFNALGYAGLDSVGFPSTAWCAHGFAIGVSVEIDVGSFFMPGFGSLAVSAGAKGERLRELMMCLVRNPGTVLSSDGTGTTLLPISMLAMRGVTWTINVKAAISAGLKAGFSVDANQGFSHNCKSFAQLEDEKKKKALAEKADPKSFWDKRGEQGLEMLSIGAEASVTATLGGSYEYDVIHLKDARPTFFSSPADESLHQSVTDFFGPGSKEGVKSRAAKFFTDQAVFKSSLKEQSWYVRGAKLLSGGRIPFSNLVESFTEARQQLDDAAALSANQDTVSKLKQIQVLHGEVQTELKSTSRKGSETKKLLKARLDTLFSDDLLVRWRPPRHFFGGNPSLSEYKSGLEDANSLADLVVNATSRDLASREVDHHLQMISAFQEYVSEPKDKLMADQVAGGDNAGLCYLDISGHKPGVEAGIEAKIDAKALGGLLGAGASASAKASKQWKFTNSRFQYHCEFANVSSRSGRARRNAVVGRRSLFSPLITTQDTTIRYSQTVLSASGKVLAMGATVAEKAGTHVFNELSYESATVRWSPPTNREKVIQALPGTGYAFGQSVSVPSLLAAYDSFLEKDDLNLFQAMVDRLGTTESQLREVLEHSWVFKEKGLKDLAANGVSAILLEATFSASLSIAIGVDLKDETKPILDDFRAKLVGGTQGMQSRSGKLESIRIRYRHADSQEGRTGFQLGIPIAPVKIGIELEAVTKAGHSAVIDLQTWWFNKLSSTNSKQAGTSIGQDDHIVPPTALMHQ